MTSPHAQSATAPSVTLTRSDVESIVIHQMGSEPEDVAAFWFLARNHKRTGGQS